ncbi:MAG: class I SAM-dependent methyltransferase [Bacteroidales bacterium]|nr:class I SAM-dependent methyltransferase [Bacteroidales bacterium]
MIEFPSSSWHDYELLDSGAGEKLERFGAFVLARPEPKALWDKSMPQSEWDRLAHTRFKPGAGFGKAGKEDSGTWERLRRMDDQWWIKYKDISLRLGLTSFKHVGVFPEQAPNWEFIYSSCRKMQHPRVLNLFAYTGAASLAAKAGGADVTHLDSVRQVVTWARQNMERSGLDGIKWIVEDAMKFARREARRGNTYDGIILDPPAYGHGPDGEKWKLDECLFEMLRTVAQIRAPHGFVVLNLYSNGYSAALGETLVREAFGLKKDSPQRISSGELALNDSFGKVLPLSIVVRLSD